MPFEAILFILVLIVALGGPIVAIILSIIAMIRTRRVKELAFRVEQLEAILRERSDIPFAAKTYTTVPVEETPDEEQAAIPAEVVPTEIVTTAKSIARVPTLQNIDWENFIGQRALGWIATTLLIFAAAFFLRYSYQNDWIGPVGRVAISAMVGCLLTIGGRQYHRRGWKIFSQTLTGAGVVILYLASYSALGFYHLLPQQHAGIFLALIIIESMALAVMYDSVAIGLVAVLGGLVTPLLLHTGHDSYAALFTYLALLDIGTIVVLVFRRWPAMGTVTLLGTHGLFWIWYTENYHPEKLNWALGFQIAILVMFLAFTVLEQLVRKRHESWEGLARVVITPALAFAAFYILLEHDYGVWMGSAAVLMASVYAALGRVTLTLRPNDRRLLLTTLAVAVGFIALAFPIQADAHWVALGWAATGSVLWWFGQRIAVPALRAIAAVLMSLAVMRVVFFDMLHGMTGPFLPILNEFALPSICVAICLLALVIATQPFLSRLGRWEQRLVSLGAFAGILLLWLVLTVDCYSFFDARAQIPGADRVRLRWLGQLSVSVLWAIYASMILAVGFRKHRASLRWLAIGAYGLTVTKVLFLDMANLQQFYRILAFFVLAVVLGLAARAYQRLGTSESRDDREGTSI